MDHCCPELVEACCRYENIMPTLSVNHSTCVITCTAIEPLRNSWKPFQLKPKSEGSGRRDSDQLRWKEGRPLLPRAGSAFILICEHPLNTLSPSQNLWHDLCGYRTTQVLASI